MSKAAGANLPRAVDGALAQASPRHHPEALSICEGSVT